MNEDRILKKCLDKEIDNSQKEDQDQHGNNELGRKKKISE
jgi:hypothetical protein